MEKYKVGIIGATGMVGQRFITLPERNTPRLWAKSGAWTFPFLSGQRTSP